MKPKRMTRAEVDDLASVMDHRLKWLRQGYLPDDFEPMVWRLLAHAQATTRGKAKDRGQS